VHGVYFGADGVAAHAPKGALLIDCSTIAITEAREAHAQADISGFIMVDAPVSGGIAAAEAGTLTFMAGGTAKAFEKAEPILKNMGKNIFHAGGAGNGQAAKIANNMLLGISMIGTCEAFNLAEKLGLDAETFFKISSVSSGQCWSMTSYCPAPGPVPTSPANRDYKPGFAVAMMLKDLHLAASAAQSAGAEIRLGEMAEAIYQSLSDRGLDGLDFSGVMKDVKGEIPRN
jgi:3-hydroxyisobutyrate dehydrogenase